MTLLEKRLVTRALAKVFNILFLHIKAFFAYLVFACKGPLLYCFAYKVLFAYFVSACGGLLSIYFANV